MSKPIARFSLLPSRGRPHCSFCWRQISTSSSTFFTSKMYCRWKWQDIVTHSYTKNQGRCVRIRSPWAWGGRSILILGSTRKWSPSPYLRVLKEGGPVVDATPSTVPQWITPVNPGAPHHLLLPGLVNAQVGGVDQATQHQIREVLTEVLKVHPGFVKMKGRVGSFRLNIMTDCKLNKTAWANITWRGWSTEDSYLQFSSVWALSY